MASSPPRKRVPDGLSTLARPASVRCARECWSQAVSVEDRGGAPKSNRASVRRADPSSLIPNGGSRSTTSARRPGSTSSASTSVCASSTSTPWSSALLAAISSTQTSTRAPSLGAGDSAARPGGRPSLRPSCPTMAVPGSEPGSSRATRIVEVLPPIGVSPLSCSKRRAGRCESAAGPHRPRSAPSCQRCRRRWRLVSRS